MSRPPDDPRPALRVGFATVAVLVLGLGGWGGFAAIDGAVMASGQVEAGRERLILQHPEGGAVAGVFVSEGDEVREGAQLIRLDDRALRNELELVGQLLWDLRARTARFEAERNDDPELRLPPEPEGHPAGDPGAALIAAQTELFALRREALSHQLARIDSRIAQLAAEAAGLEARAGAMASEHIHLREELAQHEALLARGLTSLPRVLALRRDDARLGGATAAIGFETALLTRRSEEALEERAALIAARRADAEAALRDLAPRRLELEARANELEARIARLVILAPAAGRVHALAITAPGAVLRPAEPLAEIIPAGALPLIAARLRPEDIDRLYTGQSARVLLPAGGGRDLAELPARIARLSADSYSDPQGGGRFFRAEFELLPGAEALAGDRRLMPGLPVDLRISTGTRSPLAWLLAPLTRYFGTALRED